MPPAGPQPCIRTASRAADTGPCHSRLRLLLLHLSLPLRQLQPLNPLSSLDGLVSLAVRRGQGLTAEG
jgi:hypothetical protein